MWRAEAVDRGWNRAVQCGDARAAELRLQSSCEEQWQVSFWKEEGGPTERLPVGHCKMYSMRCTRACNQCGAWCHVPCLVRVWPRCATQHATPGRSAHASCEERMGFPVCEAKCADQYLCSMLRVYNSTVERR